MKLGDLIREYREAHNMSQRQFAEKCGMSNGYIAMLEKGKNPATGKAIVPSLDKYAAFARAMGMSLGDLFQAVDSNSLVRVNVSSDSSEYETDQNTRQPERTPRFKNENASGIRDAVKGPTPLPDTEFERRNLPTASSSASISRSESASEGWGTSGTSTYGSSTHGSSTRDGLTYQERRLLIAFRNADDRAREDAMTTLLAHPRDWY